MASENPFLTDFSWRVGAAGHRFVQAIVFADKDKRARTYLTDGAVPGSAFQYKRYLPLKDETGLFKLFAEVETTEAGIKNFANQYGMLLSDGRSTIVPVEPIGSAHQNFCTGEAFDLWKSEIIAMRQTVYLWDLIHEGDVQTLAQLIIWRDDFIVYESVPELRRGSRAPSKPIGRSIRNFSADQTGPDGTQRFEKRDVVQPALYVLQTILNEKLKEETASRLLWDPDTRDLVLRMVPKSLLGALWFQLAEMISKKQGLKQCEQCGKWFRVAAGIGRTDKKYCSQRCRTQWYRNRTAKVARLHARGRTPAEIAKHFDTDVDTVETWIASGRQPVARRRPQG